MLDKLWDSLSREEKKKIWDELPNVVCPICRALYFGGPPVCPCCKNNPDESTWPWDCDHCGWVTSVSSNTCENCGQPRGSEGWLTNYLKERKLK